jgi:acyl-CoA thioesterase
VELGVSFSPFTSTWLVPLADDTRLHTRAKVALSAPLGCSICHPPLKNLPPFYANGEEKLLDFPAPGIYNRGKKFCAKAQFGGTTMKENNFYTALMERINQPDLFSAQNGILVTKCWKDYAEGELTVQHSSLNPRGIVHGGCLCTLMDTVAGIAACTGGRSCVTLNCNMNFIKAAANTEKVLCQTRKVKSGRTIAIYNSVLTDDRGEVIASGTYTFFLKEEMKEYQAYLDGAQSME